MVLGGVNGELLPGGRSDTARPSASASFFWFASKVRNSQSQMKCSCHIQDIGKSVAFGQSASSTLRLGPLMHVRRIHGHNPESSRIQVDLKIAQHLRAFVLGKAFGFVTAVQTDLEPHRLTKNAEDRFAGHLSRVSARVAAKKFSSGRRSSAFTAAHEY